MTLHIATNVHPRGEGWSIGRDGRLRSLEDLVLGDQHAQMEKIRMIAAMCRSNCSLCLLSHSKLNVLDIHFIAPSSSVWFWKCLGAWQNNVDLDCLRYSRLESHIALMSIRDVQTAHLFYRTVRPCLLITLLCYPSALLLQSLPSAKIE